MATILLLQEHLLDKSGHPCKTKAGEDPHNIGLSLDYVFGSFVSPAEMARVSAQRCLGEQSLTLLLNLSCDLLLSTSQVWTLQGHLDTSLTHACS